LHPGQHVEKGHSFLHPFLSFSFFSTPLRPSIHPSIRSPILLSLSFSLSLSLSLPHSPPLTLVPLLPSLSVSLRPSCISLCIPFRPWRTPPNDLQVNGPRLHSPLLLLPVRPRHGFSQAPSRTSLHTGHIILSQDLLPLQAQIQPRQQQHQVNTSASSTTTTLTTLTPAISTAT